MGFEISKGVSNVVAGSPKVHFLQSLQRPVKDTTKPNNCLMIGLDALIGPGGLQLLVSHLFAIPILVLWVVLEKALE